MIKTLVSPFFSRLRARLKIISQNARPDLGQTWPFLLSKTTPEELASHSTGQAVIAGYFEDFASEK